MSNTEPNTGSEPMTWNQAPGWDQESDAQPGAPGSSIFWTNQENEEKETSFPWFLQETK